MTIASRQRRRASILAFVVIAAGANPAVTAAEPEQGPTPGAVVFEIQLQVDCVRPDGRFAATNGLRLRVGDGLATGSGAAASIRLSDTTVVRVGERTEARLLDPEEKGELPIWSLLRGSLFSHSRSRGNGPRVRTRIADAATSGTDFHAAAMEELVVFHVFDGRVTVTNAQGAASATNGMEIRVKPGGRPGVQPIVIQEMIQWWVRYPAALELADVRFTEEEARAFDASISSWRRGNVAGALGNLPADFQPRLDSGRTFVAALELAAGRVDRASALLRRNRAGAAEGLRAAIAAMTPGVTNLDFAPTSASGWLGLSWWQQSRRDPGAALLSAREAARLAPQSGFAWARVAELEFSRGDVPETRRALDHALRWTPDFAPAHALRGFALAAAHRIDDALRGFDDALRLDASLSDAWLGRGLCLMRRGEREAGRIALQNAVAAEPARSILRSYLGKAWDESGDPRFARTELDFAKRLDAGDPTPWLYSALVHERDNRMNAAIRDLEHSIQLNENRAIQRSDLLLDRDRAVRGANLARLYQRAGLDDVGLREAARATTADYADWSAHLFTAQSFDVLRDTARVNLRYETPWFNELLLARMLAPAAAGAFSQNLSQQEYTRLFERDGVGLNSTTEARSDGRYRERATQWGIFGGTSWSLDLDWERREGTGHNDALSRLEIYPQLKQQFGERDSLLLLAKIYDYHGGDVRQLADPASANASLESDVSQLPIAAAGWHREWSPGIHTLLLGARLEDDQRVRTDAAAFLDLFPVPPGPPAVAFTDPLALRYHGQFEIWSAEINQIIQRAGHTLVLGGRGQWGEFQTRDALSTNSLSTLPYDNPAAGSRQVEPFHRLAIYGYDYWELARGFTLIAGVTYDRVEFPRNFLAPPVSPGTRVRDHVGPKAGAVWSITPQATLRGMYAESLAGASFDESFRLEPSQLAGFNQAHRSLLSESFGGGAAAALFRMFGAALDLKPARDLYVGLDGGVRRSDERNTIGVFDVPFIGNAAAGTLEEQRRYTESSAALSAHRLFGEEWALGIGGRWTGSELSTRRPELTASAGAAAAEDARGDLAELWLRVVFNHPSGFFARAESAWYWQKTSATGAPGASERANQVNLFAGWRFWRQRGEISAGVLNAGNEDHRLSPLTPYNEVPHERVWLGRVKVNF
jgi:tetratricopeptide (TPR) repeat protein